MKKIFALAWAMSLLALIAPTKLAAGDSDPRVPPGTDPGGVAVAVISTGIDYTQPNIAARLARDGEGEIIGWDFADDDAFPFAPAESDGNGTAFASVLLADAPGARLVPLRIDYERPATFFLAFAFIDQTPARVVVISSDGFGPEHRGSIHQTASQFDRLLIIMARDEEPDGEEDDVANVLIVPTEIANGPDWDNRPLTEPNPVQSSRGLSAVARAAAVALEIAESEPEWDGASLKRAVLARLASHRSQ
ncbi:MAG TPA: hypothetical protein VFX46_01885 [Hyphomicrobiaceae bacterium]|nr:hypothetical protein [Hyphomicrobiaceae bacterium]